MKKIDERMRRKNHVVRSRVQSRTAEKPMESLALSGVQSRQDMRFAE